MNEIAKSYWQKAVEWLDQASQSDEVNMAITMTGQAECALKMAEFAVEHPYLVGGEQEAGLPSIADSVVPQGGPIEGPRFWGAT